VPCQKRWFLDLDSFAIVTSSAPGLHNTSPPLSTSHARPCACACACAPSTYPKLAARKKPARVSRRHQPAAARRMRTSPARPHAMRGNMSLTPAVAALNPRDASSSWLLFASRTSSSVSCTRFPFQGTRCEGGGADGRGGGGGGSGGAGRARSVRDAGVQRRRRRALPPQPRRRAAAARVCGEVGRWRRRVAAGGGVRG
jgi:hypothetical protein